MAIFVECILSTALFKAVGENAILIRGKKTTYRLLQGASFKETKTVVTVLVILQALGIPFIISCSEKCPFSLLLSVSSGSEVEGEKKWSVRREKHV